MSTGDLAQFPHCAPALLLPLLLWALRERVLGACVSLDGCRLLCLLYCIILHCIVCVCAQSCPTVCDPMDCSLPGSSVPGFLQAKILEWVPISYSRGSFRPRDQTQVIGSPTSAGRFFTTSTISLCWCPNAPAPPSPRVNTGQLSACFHS